MYDRNSKYFSTAELMDQALIDLMQEKDLEYISVKELCHKAGVSRSTFYLHYQTIEDLLAETSEYVAARFSSYFDEQLKGFTEETIAHTQLDDLVLIGPNYLIPYLTFVQENKAILRAGYKFLTGEQTLAQSQLMVKPILEPILKRFGIPENHRAYYLNYYLRGTYAIIARWLENDCRDSKEEICQVIIECVIHPNALIKLQDPHEHSQKDNETT